MSSLGTLRSPPNDARMEKWIGKQLAKPLTILGMVPWRSVGQSHEASKAFFTKEGNDNFSLLISM